ncbi:MAG: hypothetical protein JXN61_14220 [Sedimentisphaerales bacterium]|nr:hypothetical protein [Sedimentisphaerales bacterium]
MARREADPVGGHLVLLRDRIDTKVYLGCVLDVSGQVHEWIELWVQNNEGLSNSPAAYRQSLSNSILDYRWIQQCRGFLALGADQIVRTGWESKHPLPTFLDLSSLSPVHPIEKNSKSPLTLCTDDGLLRQKGLPAYTSSLHRYLYISTIGADSLFVPVTKGAPENECTSSLAQVCNNTDSIILFNEGAGFVMARKHLPTSLESFVDIISGVPWGGLKHGKSELNLGKQIDSLKSDQTVLVDDGRLFLESQGKSGRLLETFYLKLRLLADIIASVRLLVSELQKPLLNISDTSFQVRLGQPGRGLPYLWTAKAELCEPGDTITLIAENTGVRYYLSASAGEASVYRPMNVSLPAKGRVSVRIRQISTTTDEITTVDGTLSTQERIEFFYHDLLWLRLNHGSGTVNLYAHLEKDSAMAPGEWRFRTVPHKISGSDLANLKRTEGIPMHETPFEVIPLLSSPCDLYALGVLATRIILVNNSTTLPLALDAVLSLARHLASTHEESKRLSVRVEETFQADNRWIAPLGPQQLLFDKITPDEALGLFPLKLWWSALAIIVRMFPGAGPDSVCKEYGDAPQGGLHKVFDQTSAELENLMIKTRTLIVPDWRASWEIAGVIRKYLERYTDQ